MARTAIRMATGTIQRKLETGDIHQTLVNNSLIIMSASRLPTKVPAKARLKIISSRSAPA